MGFGRALGWFVGFAFGYLLGYGDGYKWGKLQGTLEAFSNYVTARVRSSGIIEARIPSKRRGWSWKGRKP